MENSSRVPMPQEKLGAMPRLSCLAPKLSDSCTMAFRRKAAFSPVMKLKSPVMRCVLPVP